VCLELASNPLDHADVTHSIIRLEGVRQRWNPRPVSVIIHKTCF
jgi:hypothetical protein